MRKVIVSNLITLDGFFAGPNGELDWHVVDEEFNQFAADQLNTMDNILLGRVTYEGMASYWPTPNAIADDPVIAEQMNSMRKIVFSNTLQKAEWNNSRLVHGDAAQEVSRLKQQPGKDMVIFGSGKLVSTLTGHRLIDEYRMLVNPVILGSGRSQFEGLAQPVKLKLLSTRSFKSGVVLLAFEPARP